MKKNNPFLKLSDQQKREASVTHTEDGKFNPAVDGDQIRQLLQSSSMNKTASRAFSEKNGEVNAYTKKEAMQIVANIINNHMDSARDIKQPELDKAKIKELIRNASKSRRGFEYVAQEVVAPIPDVLTYRGMTRSMMKKVDIPQGERHIVPLDVRATASVIAKSGKSTEVSELKAKYRTAEPFPITSNAKMSIFELHEARYDMLSRIQESMREEIEREEDKRFIALVDTASRNSVNLEINYANAPSVGVFENLKYQLEQHPKNAGAFIMHRRELNLLINAWAGDNTVVGSSGGPSPVDFVTQRETILSGWVGNILGVPLKISSGSRTADIVVPTGRIYVVAPPEELGEFGIHIDLQAEPYDGTPLGEATKGFHAVEYVSYVIPRNYAVSRAVRAS